VDAVKRVGEVAGQGICGGDGAGAGAEGCYCASMGDDWRVCIAFGDLVTATLMRIRPSGSGGSAIATCAWTAAWEAEHLGTGVWPRKARHQHAYEVGAHAGAGRAQAGDR